MKKVMFWGAIALAALPMSPAQARTVGPLQVPCWFLRSEEIELQQTCTYKFDSWAGGGVISLIWEDGVQTALMWGFHRRGEKPCGDEWDVDGVCGTKYFRQPDTFEVMPQTEVDRRVGNQQDFISCIQVNENSVCWLR